MMLVPPFGLLLPSGSLQGRSLARAVSTAAQGARASRKPPTVSRPPGSGPGPWRVDNPTELPGAARPFDLGPFARHHITETKGSPDMRLDRWIMKHVCSNWNAAQKLIVAKQVWVMRPDCTSEEHRSSVVIPRFRPPCQGSTRLMSGDYIYFPRVMRPAPKRRQRTERGTEPMDWLVSRVIYKDTDFLAINKPAGWSVTGGKHVGDVHLQRFLPSLRFGLDEEPQFVHRLSTELTGVLLLARHRAAAAYVKDVIQQRAFWHRSFWGLACGRAQQSGTVSIPLGSERLGPRMVSKPRREDDGGLPALTEYKTLLFSPLAGGISLLDLNPYSGRHHQTRAHCAFGLHAPLVGDPVYYSLSNRLGRETKLGLQVHSEESRRARKEVLGPQPKLHLHSRQMRLKTFAGKEIVITAPLPEHVVRSCHALGWGDYLRRADHQASASSSWSPDSDHHVSEALARLAVQQQGAAHSEAGIGPHLQVVDAGASEDEDQEAHLFRNAETGGALRQRWLRESIGGQQGQHDDHVEKPLSASLSLLETLPGAMDAEAENQSKGGGRRSGRTSTRRSLGPQGIQTEMTGLDLWNRVGRRYSTLRR